MPHQGLFWRHPLVAFILRQKRTGLFLNGTGHFTHRLADARPFATAEDAMAAGRKIIEARGGQSDEQTVRQVFDTPRCTVQPGWLLDHAIQQEW
jgi:hypothetical protein